MDSSGSFSSNAIAEFTSELILSNSLTWEFRISSHRLMPFCAGVISISAIFKISNKSKYTRCALSNRFSLSKFVACSNSVFSGFSRRLSRILPRCVVAIFSTTVISLSNSLSNSGSFPANFLSNLAKDEIPNTSGWIIPFQWFGMASFMIKSKISSRSSSSSSSKSILFTTTNDWLTVCWTSFIKLNSVFFPPPCLASIKKIAKSVSSDTCFVCCLWLSIPALVPGVSTSSILFFSQGKGISMIIFFTSSARSPSFVHSFKNSRISPSCFLSVFKTDCRPTNRVQKGGSSLNNSKCSSLFKWTKMLNSFAKRIYVGTAVVGSTATDNMASPINPLMKVVLPELNSPKTDIRIGCSLINVNISFWVKLYWDIKWYRLFFLLFFPFFLAFQ